jgi:hypothetical protein
LKRRRIDTDASATREPGAGLAVRLDGIECRLCSGRWMVAALMVGVWNRFASIVKRDKKAEKKRAKAATQCVDVAVCRESTA